MGFGFSLALTAAGAILVWAVNASSSAVDIHTIGYILLGVGVAGLVLSLAFWSSWGGAGVARSRRTTVDPSSGSRVTEERTESY